MKYNSIINKIQSVLSDDLLNDNWKKIIKKEINHPTAGHCYAASEALYHILGGKEKGFKPFVSKHKNKTHWWIEDKNGNILDPTAEQFYFKNELPPYKNKRGNGYLTKLPSKRAQIIINRVNSIEKYIYLQEKKERISNIYSNNIS